MTFQKALHAAKTHITSSWKHISVKHPLLHLVIASLVAGVAAPVQSGRKSRQPL